MSENMGFCTMCGGLVGIDARGNVRPHTTTAGWMSPGACPGGGKAPLTSAGQSPTLEERVGVLERNQRYNWKKVSHLESAIFGPDGWVRRRDVVEGLDKLLAAARRSKDPRDLVGMAWALKRRFERGVGEPTAQEPDSNSAGNVRKQWSNEEWDRRFQKPKVGDMGEDITQD